MKKYLVLFAGVFMFSACCATTPVRQVDVYGPDISYQVKIRSYPRHHIHHHHHPIIIRPARPKHIAPSPVGPSHHHPGLRG